VAFARRSLPANLVGVFLLAVIGWLFAYFFDIALVRYPDFDGALNLNVAKSLLEGNGYRNFYNEWVPFFPETNAPFILPAVGAIALFGVSPIGTQLVNLLYLVAFALLVFLLVARLSNRLTALIAVFVSLQAPGVYSFGMNGYGEVAALTFMLAACVVLCRALESDRRGLVIAGGAFLALSYLTKTVALIWIAPVVICFLAARPRNRTRADATYLVLSIALPIIAWEVYRLATLHGFDQYAHWWRIKLTDILDRASPSTRLQDTPGWLNKAQTHATLLEGWLGFPARGLTIAYLVALTLAAFSVIRNWRNDAGGRFVFASLFLTTILYFAWWIFLTPTQEAWLRRIMNGLIVAEMVTILAIYRLAWVRSPVAVVSLIALGAALTVTVAHNQLLWDRPDDRPQTATNRAFFDRVSALPQASELYAAAWYQSPVTALVTGRKFFDFTRHSSTEINGNGKERFLVIEQVALYQRGWLADVLKRCVCEAVFANGGGRIYRIRAARDDAGGLATTTIITPDSSVFGTGFFSGDSDTRWSSERAQLRLPLSDFDQLLLWLHVPALEQMTTHPSPSVLEIHQGDCRLARAELAGGENQLLIENTCRGKAHGDTLEFHMNGHIRPAAAAPDTRELAWLFRSMELIRAVPISLADDVAKP
jgi:4-amino-4-deoxy-L-arabinose transferase-like glycosyltransferase